MADYRSVQRKTETARHLEFFLDALSYEEFSFGFDHLTTSLEEVAEAIDSEALELEEYIEELESKLKEAQNTISSLEEERT